MISLQGCSDWWVRSKKEVELVEPDLLEWLQASVYFLPHVAFRLAALSLILAFIGYYSIALLALIALIAFCLALPVVWKLEWNGDDDDGITALLALALTLFSSLPSPSNLLSPRTAV